MRDLKTYLSVAPVIELYDSSEKGMITTFFCITGFLFTRWFFGGHLPLSNLYESLIFLSWTFSVIHIVPFFKKYKNHSVSLTHKWLRVHALIEANFEY